MIRRHTWLIVSLMALVVLWGCSDDDTVTNPVPQSTNFDVMVAAASAYINDSSPDGAPGVKSAMDVNSNLGDYTVIDIRAQADYDAGHVNGAYHSSLATLIQDLKVIPNNKPYVVACYTGQSAGHVKIAMELLGYKDVYSMTFGMSAWNSTLSGSWDNNCKNELGNPEKVNNNGDLTKHGFPTLTGSKATIVEDRVAWMLQNGFKAKSYDSIRDNLDDYFIMNYFSEADYMGTGTAGVPGHIPGAYHFTPYQSLGKDQMLDRLPTNKPIIVYCWTGQHSSQVTAYLNMLGYEAYSLKFGSNYLFHDDLLGHKWSDNAKNDFPLVP